MTRVARAGVAPRSSSCTADHVDILPATSRPARVRLQPDTYAQLERMADGTTVTLDVQVKAAAKSQTWNAMRRLTGRANSSFKPQWLPGKKP